MQRATFAGYAHRQAPPYPEFTLRPGVSNLDMMSIDRIDVLARAPILNLPTSLKCGLARSQSSRTPADPLSPPHRVSQVMWALSVGHRNGSGEYLARRHPIKGLSRTLIEFCRDLIESLSVVHG